MATIYPYLNFQGNTEEAFNFYKSVFGGEFIVLQRFKGMPGEETIPADEQEKIMHISLAIGKGSFLMASDALASMGQTVVVGNNFYLSINAESEEEADNLFKGLSAGGQVTMPLAKAFWGAYFGMFTDKFGVNWMINYDFNQKK